MIRFITLVLLSAIMYGASAMDIEAQIMKIRSASDENRYILVNQLKRELSKLGRDERMNAIIALKAQTGSSAVKSPDVTVVASNSESGQHKVLSQHQSVVSVATVTDVTVGGSSTVVDTASVVSAAGASSSAVPSVANQVTPQRPDTTVIASSVTAQSNVPVVGNQVTPQKPQPNSATMASTAAASIPQGQMMQQTMKMANNTRIISYRI